MLILKQLLKEIIDELDEIGGAGGVIAIDFNGKIAMPFNTPRHDKR